MSYYFSKILDVSFDEAVARATAELKKEGFGILTEIDVQQTLKSKLDVTLKQYRILGACNPLFAYEALRAEERIGLMLPCNVIVREISDAKTEVAAIDPVASMAAIDNQHLRDVGGRVRHKLKAIIDNL